MKHKKYSNRKKHNIFKKTLDTSVNLLKNTNHKYMPKLKHGLENVGSKVVQSSQKTIPFLQQLTRKFLGIFGLKSKSKTRKYR